jgi:hypothetical protein
MMPAMIRHIEEPKGSATTPPRPSLTKVAETPKTASAPNQVANTVAVTTGSGRRRPATAKSLGVMDPGRGVQADADRHHQIEDHEPEQHGRDQ